MHARQRRACDDPTYRRTRCPPAARSSRPCTLHPSKPRHDPKRQRLIRPTSAIQTGALHTAAKGARPSGEAVNAVAGDARVESGGALRARRLARERLVGRDGALCILADISQKWQERLLKLRTRCNRGRLAYECRSRRHQWRCWSSSRPRKRTSQSRPAAGSCQSGRLRFETILRRKARRGQKTKNACAKRAAGRPQCYVAFTIAHEGGPGRHLVVAAVHTSRDDAATRATGDARARVGVEVGLVAERRARCSRRRQVVNDVDRTS